MPCHFTVFKNTQRLVPQQEAAQAQAFRHLSRQPSRWVGIMIAGDPGEVRAGTQRFKQPPVLLHNPLAREPI